MKNIRLIIEYDGEPYCGWQRQDPLPTVQAVVEDLLTKIQGKRTILMGAGRTDSGVHAKGQVGNFYATIDMPPERWALAMNTKLPPTIRIVKSEEVGLKFHSQKGAKSKLYEYRVLNRRFASALERRVYFWPNRLDWEQMRAAAQVFVGTHDFRSFQSGPNQVSSTVRTLTRFDITRETENPDIYCFSVEGTGFLKQMVRNLVGTVMEVGQGVRDIEGLPDVLKSRDRERAGRAVPAKGLTLVWVKYGDESGGLER